VLSVAAAAASRLATEGPPSQFELDVDDEEHAAAGPIPPSAAPEPEPAATRR
jgi:hypothetical protein